MRRAISVLLIAVVAAFTFAACGGSEDEAPPTKAEYKQEYTALSKELATVGAAVGKAVNESAGKSNKQLKERFSEVADQTRAIATKFEDATPPDDAKIETQVAKLVAGLNVAADDLEAISKAAGKDDLKGAGEAAAKLTRDNEGVAAPRRELDVLVLGVKPPTQTTTTTTKKK
jgi:hypothetical protein